MGTNQLPAAFNMTLAQYEAFTAAEAIDVYESAFGVLSPKISWVQARRSRSIVIAIN